MPVFPSIGTCLSAQVRYSAGIKTERHRALFSKIPNDCFGAGVHVQLLVNAAEVFADGIDADSEPIGNFFVKTSLCQELQHFLLSLR
jgi:hypothetical protein